MEGAREDDSARTRGERGDSDVVGRTEPALHPCRQPTDANLVFY